MRRSKTARAGILREQSPRFMPIEDDRSDQRVVYCTLRAGEKPSGSKEFVEPIVGTIPLNNAPPDLAAYVVVLSYDSAEVAKLLQYLEFVAVH